MTDAEKLEAIRALEAQLAALCPGARLLPGYQCRRADEETVRAWLAGIDLL